jgi:hypothetical protein
MHSDTRRIKGLGCLAGTLLVALVLAATAAARVAPAGEPGGVARLEEKIGGIVAEFAVLEDRLCDEKMERRGLEQLLPLIEAETENEVPGEKTNEQEVALFTQIDEIETRLYHLARTVTAGVLQVAAWQFSIDAKTAAIERDEFIIGEAEFHRRQHGENERFLKELREAVRKEAHGGFKGVTRRSLHVPGFSPDDTRTPIKLEENCVA